MRVLRGFVRIGPMVERIVVVVPDKPTRNVYFSQSVRADIVGQLRLNPARQQRFEQGFGARGLSAVVLAEHDALQTAHLRNHARPRDVGRDVGRRRP